MRRWARRRPRIRQKCLIILLRRERTPRTVNIRRTWHDHAPYIGFYLVDFNLGNEQEERVVLSPKGPLARFPLHFGYVGRETGACLTRPCKTLPTSLSPLSLIVILNYTLLASDIIVSDQKSILLVLLYQTKVVRTTCYFVFCTFHTR